ncbi:hypothetical protein L6R53_10820 [Myxococcota bacterium]|nr:hypothetical protein [Myxococcota bacterium]
MSPRPASKVRRELADVVSLETERQLRAGVTQVRVPSAPEPPGEDLPWFDVGCMPDSLRDLLAEEPEEESGFELTLELPASALPSAGEPTEDEDTVEGEAAGGLILEEETGEAITRAFLCNVVQLRTSDGMEPVTVTTELPEALTDQLDPHQLAPVDPALRDDAELRIALVNRARQEIQDGLLEEADETLERALALLPGDPLVLVHQAWVRLLAGEAFFAAWQAERAVAVRTGDPVVAELADALAAEVAERLPF